MTIICKTIDDWRTFQQQCAPDATLGFVPTMGNLHLGHESLIKASRNDNDLTVVSIFVNPTQFNQTADYEKYPITFEEDLSKLESLDVDVLFCPAAEAMYPHGYRFKISEQQTSQVMEGQYRPGHFEGMLTVVMKLLCLIRPHKAYFGQKDYQQLKLVETLVEDFFLPTTIVAGETIRNSQGLALSSRNNLLSSQALQKAALFPQALLNSPSARLAAQTLEQQDFQVDYIEDHFGRRFGAVWCEGVRLIDNVVPTQGDSL